MDGKLEIMCGFRWFWCWIERKQSHVNLWPIKKGRYQPSFMLFFSLSCYKMIEMMFSSFPLSLCILIMELIMTWVGLCMNSTTNEIEAHTHQKEEVYHDGDQISAMIL